MIGGDIVNDMPPKDRDIAMVFQNYALYPHMTVYQNRSFGLRLKRVAKDEIQRRVGNAAKILDITELLERKPRQLSGGQRQPVAMGRAIVRDPKVFHFDEPLSNLDAKMRVQMRTEIKKVHRQHREPDQHVFEAPIEVTEPMGMETQVYFKLNGADVCGRVNPLSGSVEGQRQTLVADLRQMHMIDDQSGRVL